eukprot:Phypoly_transcript_02834.p1 GENE.Phypoly_transcript_02834~~Phypoly_transcript_02834.p1  ORF type:complete len:446 (+),score=62.19 Phypoly_transcript_02834:172-1338(+)
MEFQILNSELATLHTELDDLREQKLQLESIHAQRSIKVKGMETEIFIHFHKQFHCLDAVIISPNLWQHSLKFDLRKQSRILPKCFVNVQLNLLELEKEIKKDHVDRKVVCEALMSALDKSLHTRKIDFGQNLGEIKPRAQFPIIKQPNGFRDGLKLHKYQIEALSWMLHFEKNPEIRDTSHLLAWRSRDFTTIMDIHSQKWVQGLPLPYIQHRSKGGILADETGLGKTMIVIGLILATRATPIDLSSITNVKETKKIKEERAEAAAHKEKFLKFLKPPKKSKSGKKPKKKKAKVEDDFSGEYAEIDNSDQLYPTKATLVLCRHHLVTQWNDEITQSTRDLTVVGVTTLEDFRKRNMKRKGTGKRKRRELLTLKIIPSFVSASFDNAVE